MSPEARAALRLIQDAPTPRQRYNAFVQLTNGGDHSLLPILTTRITDSTDWGERQCAAWVVGQLRLAAGVPMLVQCITRQGEDEQVRYVAALALTFIGGEAASTALDALTQHEAEAVRRVAWSARYALTYTNVR